MTLIYWVLGSFVLLCLVIGAGLWFERWVRRQSEADEKADLQKAIYRANARYRK